MSLLNSIEKRLQRREDRRKALIVTALTLVVVYIIWNLPAFRFVLYPLNLFVTYVHEAGHALAAVVTGGQIDGFLVSPDGSGLARTIGGSRFLILPAGYLGAALFGSVLFYLTNRFPRFSNAIAVALGLFMIGFTLLFARPDETGALTAIVIGVGFGVVLLMIGLKATRFITQFTLNTLAVLTTLNAVLDVVYLVSNADAGRGVIRNDAAAFASEVMPIVPASVVALTWAGLAIGMLAIAGYYGIIKPLREEINDAYNEQVRKKD